MQITLRGERFYVKLHCLNYWIGQDFSSDISKDLDISHLCHLRSCVKLTHLNAETRKINNQRKNCVKSKKCFGHDNQPDCLF